MLGWKLQCSLQDKQETSFQRWFIWDQKLKMCTIIVFSNLSTAFKIKTTTILKIVWYYQLVLDRYQLLEWSSKSILRLVSSPLENRKLFPDVLTFVINSLCFCKTWLPIHKSIRYECTCFIQIWIGLIKQILLLTIVPTRGQQ